MARDVTKLSYVQISVSLYGLVIVSRASKGPYSTVIGTLMGGGGYIWHGSRICDNHV